MVMKKRSWVVIASLYRSRKINHEETKSAKKRNRIYRLFLRALRLFVSLLEAGLIFDIEWSGPLPEG